MIELEEELNHMINEAESTLQRLDKELRALHQNPGLTPMSELEQRAHFLDLFKEQLAFVRVYKI